MGPLAWRARRASTAADVGVEGEVGADTARAAEPEQVGDEHPDAAPLELGRHVAPHPA